MASPHASPSRTVAGDEPKPSRMGLIGAGLIDTLRNRKGSASSSSGPAPKAPESRARASSSPVRPLPSAPEDRVKVHQGYVRAMMAEDLTSTFPPSSSVKFGTPSPVSSPSKATLAPPSLLAIHPSAPISPIAVPVPLAVGSLVHSTSALTLDEQALPASALTGTSSSPVLQLARPVRRARSPSSSPVLTRPTLAPSQSANPSVSSSSIQRRMPIFPHANVTAAPATAMYWSATPISGKLSAKGMRAHSATLIDSDIWIFGGCDIRGSCFRDVWKMQADTFMWSKPKCIGDVPPPTRAHSCTAVDKYLFMFGGGDGPNYFNETFYLDTVYHKWVKPSIHGTPPSPRRAHTAVLYRNRILFFGGGNGATALNDLHALHVADMRRLRWQAIEIKGDKKPPPRGYHSMELVGNSLVVIGGSDGAVCYSDVWVLDLDSLVWTEINLGPNSSFLFPRLCHTSTRVGSYILVAGGHDGVSYTNDILLFNLVTLQWETRPLYGEPPSPRGYSATVIYDSRILFCMGYDGTTVFNDVHTLDLGGSAFLPQITNFSLEIPSEDESR